MRVFIDIVERHRRPTTLGQPSAIGEPLADTHRIANADNDPVADGGQRPNDRVEP